MADTATAIEISVPKNIPPEHAIKLRKWLRLHTIAFVYRTLHIVIPYNSICFFFTLLTRKATPHDAEFYKTFITQYLNASPAKAESFAKEIFYLRDVYDKHKREGTLPSNFEEIIAMEEEIVTKYERPHKVCRFPDIKDRIPFSIPLTDHFFQKGLLPILKLNNVPRELNNVLEVSEEFSRFGDLVRVTTDQDTRRAEIYFSQALAVIMCIRYYKHGVQDDNKFRNVEMVAFVNRLQLGAQGTGDSSVDVLQGAQGVQVTLSVEAGADTTTDNGNNLRDMANLREYVKTVNADMAGTLETQSKTGDTRGDLNSASPKKGGPTEKRDKKTVVVTNIPDIYHGASFLSSKLITKREAVKSIQEGFSKMGEYYLQIEMHTAPAAIGLLKTIHTQKENYGGIDAAFLPVDFELFNSKVIL